MIETENSSSAAYDEIVQLLNEDKNERLMKAVEIACTDYDAKTSIVEQINSDTGSSDSGSVETATTICTDVKQINLESVPTYLRNLKIWVLYKLIPRPDSEKPAKKPCMPNWKDAKTNDPATWSSLDEVLSAYKTGAFDGIGIMLNGSGIVVMDFDNCVDENGNIDPEVLKIIHLANSHTHYSPSETGIHIICKGKKPGDACRAGLFEIYEEARFITFTPHRVPGTPFELMKHRKQLMLYMIR